VALRKPFHPRNGWRKPSIAGLLFTRLARVEALVELTGAFVRRGWGRRGGYPQTYGTHEQGKAKKYKAAGRARPYLHHRT